MSSRNNNNNSLPFQTLSDSDFNIINHESESRFSQSDMDRLNQLKFNAFQSNNDISLCENNANLDMSFDINKINCNIPICRLRKSCKTICN